MILYKYRGDNHYTESIFSEKKIYLATQRELNDPCECSLQTIEEDWLSDIVRKHKEAQLSGFVYFAWLDIKAGKKFWGLSPKDAAGVLNRMSALPTFEERYQRFRSFIERRNGHPPSDPTQIFPKLAVQLQTVGIFSMSEVPDNPLMWAHYSTNKTNTSHSGVCIGFEIPDEKINSAENYLKVEYTNEVPKFGGEGYRAQTNFYLGENGMLRPEAVVSFEDPVFQKAITTKSPEWGYEREWRYVQPKGGMYNWPGPIKEITLGLRCPKERRDFYINLTKKYIPNKVSFFEIKQVPNSNTIERVVLELE